MAYNTRVGVGGTGCKCQKPSGREVCSHLCRRTCCLLCVRPPKLQRCSCIHRSLCVRSFSCPPIWERVIGHRVCCGSDQDVNAKKWPQGRVSDGSAPFVVGAATLFVYTRHRQSPADVPRLLSLVWCEMRRLCWERATCESKAKNDAPAAVVSRAACVSRAQPADASRPAWSLRVNLLSTISFDRNH